MFMYNSIIINYQLSIVAFSSLKYIGWEKFAAREFISTVFLLAPRDERGSAERDVHC